MSVLQPAQWARADVDRVAAQPVPLAGSALPEKRAYGSNHMFIDRGQQRGLTMPDRGNHAAVSGAAGGFSTVWGAQIMPFSRATFDRWPFGWDEIEPHYKGVLDEVPLAAEEDDYAEDFPLLAARAPAARVRADCCRAGALWAPSRRHPRQGPRRRQGAAGFGRGLLYALWPVHDRLSVLVDLLRAPDARPVRRRWTRARDLACAGRPRRSACRRQAVGSRHRPHDRARDAPDADRVSVGAGGLGTTRIALNSLSAPPNQVALQESAQFLVPFVSRRGTGDRRGQRDFTLNQFNLLVKYDDEAYTTSQVHCYPYNPAVAEALPGWLPRSWTGPVLGRVTAGLGYLPSWRSPRMRVDIRARHENALPDVAVRVVSDERPATLRSVLRRLAAIGPGLDLFPVLPMVRLSGPGKSYHFGSTFPHGSGSDLISRVGQFRNVHLIDGAVLPSVPSTTFTFTVMANAHRIVTMSRHV